MHRRTIIGTAVLTLGIATLAGQAIRHGGTATREPAAPTAASSAAAAAGADYATVLADLDRRIDGLQYRADTRPTDWLTRVRLGGLLLERAGLTNQPDDFARVQATLDEVAAAYPLGVALLGARFNFMIHRLAEAERWLVTLGGHKVPQRDDKLLAHLLRGEIAFQRGQYADALAKISEVFTAEPAVAAGPLATYHAKTGDPDRASALLEEAFAATPVIDPQRRAWLKLQLGLLAMNRGELQAAHDQLAAADAELSGWWLVREHQAELHARRSQHAEAIALYEEIVRTADLPQHMDALAALYRHQGQPERADELVARAAARWDAQLARFPESAMGHALAHYMQFGTPERALELALANHAARPGGDASVALARAYLKAGRPPDALATAEQVLATPYRTAALHDVAAKAHTALGDTAAAEEQTARCYALNPYYSGEDHTH